MAINRTYGCKACGHTWQFLHMSRDEPKPPCPNGCKARPAEGLSAPSIGRGAVDTGIAVPQSQGARETLAASLALQHTGMGDINSHMKPGDIAAKPIAAPSLKDLPAGAQEALRAAATPKFVPINTGPVMGQAASDPYRTRNMGVLGAINRTAPLNRLRRTKIV